MARPSPEQLLRDAAAGDQASRGRPGRAGKPTRTRGRTPSFALYVGSWAPSPPKGYDVLHVLAEREVARRFQPADCQNTMQNSTDPNEPTSTSQHQHEE